MIVIAASPEAAVRIARVVGPVAGYPSLEATYARLDELPRLEGQRMRVITVPAQAYGPPVGILVPMIKSGLIAASFAVLIACVGVASLWEALA